MAPFESASTDDPDGVPDYFTPERLVSYAILGSARQTLNYRYFLVQNASRTIDEIQAGRLDRWSPVAEGERQNLVRALNAQIIQETVAIIEALAAVSMNPDDPPKDRAKQLLTYRTGEIYDFYRSIDEDVGHDRLASIFSYPDVDDLEIAEMDEPYYQAYMEGNLEAYHEFFLVTTKAWDVLKQARNKITHGFFIFMNEQQTLVTEHGESVELPDWADDYLATADWDDDDFEPHVLLMGDDPRSSYLSICSNAVTVTDHVLEGMMRKIQNEGEPVLPRFLFGHTDLPEEGPETEPTVGVSEITNNFRVVLETDFREEQEELFDAVDQFLETHS